MPPKRRVSAKRFLAAIESGDIELVQRLLAQGADVRGCWRESPSVCAARNGHTDILALLIRHGLHPREYDDLLFSVALYWKQSDVAKILAAAIFAPDLWRGKTLLDLQKEADLIELNIDRNLSNDMDQDALRSTRLLLFDAAMTCWEHVRPDPPKLKISPIPAKGNPV
jgi:ankyrin repeat protein